MNKNKQIFSSLTILYFLLGFVNIHLSSLALFCLVTPLVLLMKNRKNLWCSGICPRADYLSLFRFVNLGLRMPRWLVNLKAKNLVLTYVCFNLLLIGLSSFMVSQGKIAPIDKIRLFIFLQIPWDMPQMIHYHLYNPLLLHLSFRLYSLMLSSTILGTVLAILYKPRTWCVLCPVKTLSQRYLNQFS
ncbi:4Fe-4S binding protein [Oceanispirochaeta sp.]|jgi:hypothetical protein|uniref:4Fe-4S binding protein n=1 Tax=Oceanispirochaeta sp. TaxID=2035350 RepID=UPI00260B44DA|nr:4Fe-4S binding protein [Oceanispirochaeta sp.]MDA3957035.1 4Fe-4S binding protein [Oceanispirochaeta sp.]